MNAAIRTATLLVMCLSSTLARGSIVVFQAGSVDGFALPADPSSPSAELVAIDPGLVGGPSQDFDLIAGVNGGTGNTWVGHTFTGLPTGVVGATLTLRVRAGINGGVFTDGVMLSFVDASTTSYLDAMVFSRSFGALNQATNHFSNPDPGLLTNDAWSIGDEATFSLDLANLPLADGRTLDLLPELNRHGSLDAIVGDETGVDYMQLTVTVPEPSAIALAGIGVGLLAFCGRRRSCSRAQSNAGSGEISRHRDRTS